MSRSPPLFEELISEGNMHLGSILGTVAMEALKLNEAIEVLRKFSLIQRHPETRTLRIHRLVQAVLFERQGMHEQAEPLHQRALRIREQALGFDHPMVASSLMGLANFYREQRKDAQAEPLYQRALRIREQTLGPEHPDTAETLYNFAALREAQGRKQEAVSLYQRTLMIWEHTLGAAHPKTNETREHLGTLLQTRDGSDG